MDFIKVRDFEDSEVVEVPIEDDGTLDLDNITVKFPGATGLEYRINDHVRIVKITNGKLYAPKGGWIDNVVYCCIFPKVRTNIKEEKEAVVAISSDETYPPPAKKRRSDESSTVKEFSLGVSELPKTEQLHNRFFLAANNKFSNPVEMAAAYWASTFLLPDFSALEKDFVELMDGTSLLVLRNRIDYLELLFLVQDLPLSKLLSDLNLSASDVDQITTNVMTKIANHNKRLGLSELSAVVAQEVIRTTQTSSTASQTPDPSMSKTISVKASIHYHRWKHAFQYPRHSGIAKIKASLDDSVIDYEDFFIEIAALFTVCSTAGVHLRLVAKCGVESIVRSLMVYSMNQPITVGTVKSLYCSIP